MLETGDFAFDSVTGANVQVLERIEAWGYTSYRVFSPSTGIVYKATEEQLNKDGGTNTYDENYLRYVTLLSKIKNETAGGLLSSLASGVIPLPHQLHVLNRAMESNNIRYILADEVGLGKTIEAGMIIVSIAAGQTINRLTNAFKCDTIKLVRVMPNTPALVGEGMAAVSFNDVMQKPENKAEADYIGSLFEALGRAETVPEKLMDTVTGVSGSSPAYIFMLIEAMADAAVLGGMPRNQAYVFAAQSVLGSAKMLLDSGKHPGELKDMVCSPAGTTIEAVKVLENEGFRSAVINAIEACIKKSESM